MGINMFYWIQTLALCFCSGSKHVVCMKFEIKTFKMVQIQDPLLQANSLFLESTDIEHQIFGCGDA